MPITNNELSDFTFLKEMDNDGYFPKVCVDAVRRVLVELCEQIEREQPVDLHTLYRLTHAATERINDLAEMFDEHGSEIETGAREAIAADFASIAAAYGFASADIEDLIAPRDW